MRSFLACVGIDAACGCVHTTLASHPMFRLHRFLRSSTASLRTTSPGRLSGRATRGRLCSATSSRLQAHRKSAAVARSLCLLSRRSSPTSGRAPVPLPSLPCSALCFRTTQMWTVPPHHRHCQIQMDAVSLLVVTEVRAARFFAAAISFTLPQCISCRHWKNDPGCSRGVLARHSQAL